LAGKLLGLNPLVRLSKPVGAYEIMDHLAKLKGRTIAPPTVYRALDFLIENGLIHRIERMNDQLSKVVTLLNHRDALNRGERQRNHRVSDYTASMRRTKALRSHSG